MAIEQFSGWRDYRLSARLEEVMKTLERDEMGSVYAECKRLEYESPALEEIEKLMGVSEQELLKMQYKRATETGQQQRAIEKEIELKELCLEQFGANFVFEKCQMLRDPVDYANAKTFSLHRDDHAAGMLMHSTSSIITSLTRLEDPADIKDAINCFKCILGYAGDTKATYPDSSGVRLIEIGIEAHDWLRGEIYAQLMKQLVNNNNGFKKDKVWELMMLCLLHFGPGEGMENFVQIFIRENADDRLKDSLIRQCHISAYEDGPGAAPPVAMLSSMLRQHGF